jgi:hypothetical protein
MRSASAPQSVRAAQRMVTHAANPSIHGQTSCPEMAVAAREARVIEVVTSR